MTKEDLLKASIEEFRDNVKNASVYTCQQIITDSGYKYLIKDEESRFDISCAIHWNASFETNTTIGKHERNEVSINTRVKLPFDCIIEYNGFVVSITSQDDYNATMGQWHYNGMGAYAHISNRFLVTTEEEIDSKIGINCLSLIMPLDLGYPIIPSFYSASKHNKYIMVDIQDSEALSPVYRRDLDLVQYRQDNVKMSFINMDTLEAMQCVEKLQNYSLNPQESNFAINDYISLRDENIYQKSFDWKSLTYCAEFHINYYLKAQDKTQQLQIRQALFRVLRYM